MSVYEKNIVDLSDIQIEEEIKDYSRYIEEYNWYVDNLRDEKLRRTERRVHLLTEEIGRLKVSINKLELDSSSESDNGDATQAGLPILPAHKRNRKIKSGKLTNSKSPVIKRKLPSSRNNLILKDQF